MKSQQPIDKKINPLKSQQLINKKYKSLKKPNNLSINKNRQ